ncbi:hypothetical protein HY29_08040 [Hyphomonas beringensis]|uniref:Salt-induced outer membrane protein n=1 Tax=Hyphomonas beringensis TaxID=1280946 RepID=A0A062UIW1_9PROT|nr:DUF481 domain-containing protein [Hyphomonas beringensis]KCZ56524.1 hypothetical protein HY29_08040 [Hyphomonas beringensis]
MTAYNKMILGTAVIAALTSAPAFAEGDQDGWVGEASISAGMTTGNTETTQAGLGVDVDRNDGDWTFGLQLSGDYGEEDGIESRNRYMVAADLDHDFNDTMFAFARGSYEVDQFTGFDSRSFIGGGIGWHVLDKEEHHWTVRGGPGMKIDEVKRRITVDQNGAALIIPAMTERSLGAVAQSDYFLAFNDAVSLSNKSSVVYGEESTQLTNSLALTAALNGHLSARISFDVRHDTDPQPEFEATDTATKFSIVYKLGH